jgi:glycosyltransferase involved in cell wall biosynthesis
MTQPISCEIDKPGSALLDGRAEPQPQIPLFLMIDSLQTGGSERQFAALAASFDHSRFNVRVGCLQKKGGFLEGLGEVSEFPLGGNLYGLPAMQARVRLARYLRQSRCAIAYAFDFYTNLLLIPVARMARVPIVIGSQRQLGDLLTPAKSRAQKAVLSWCDAIICNSHAAAARLVAQGLPQGRIAVIGNGLPPSAFEPAVPALLPSNSRFRIGMIARMNTSAKRHSLFLRAAMRVLRRFPETEFVLAGDGPLRMQLEREAEKLGIRDRVLFLGDRRDIPAILASTHISVMPSISESLSNAILESMAAGIPVVASHVGGNAELINADRGILVAPDDELGLAGAIERLMRDPFMRAEFGRDGKKFAASNFTMERIQKKHEELYLDLLSRKMRRQKSSAGAPPRIHPPPLKLAIVAASPRYVGGQSVQASLLAANWRGDPIVEPCFIPIDPAFPSLLRWVERVPLLRTVIREPIYLAALWKGIRSADIAHIFAASYWSFLIAPLPAWLVARLHGKKTLIHYHSGEAPDHLRHSRVARSVLQRVDRVVVPSQYLVDVFRGFSLSADAVPNVVDMSQFHFRVRDPLTPHLLCTRGFHPYYRLDLVVRAFADIQQEFPHARLDLLGGGPLEKEIHALVYRLGLKNVTFCGVANHSQIAGFYDAADIFINASSLDNMPVSILEAFASGTPVVSTAPNGMRYLVEHERTGLLSDPGDARALAQNVIRLLNDPGLSARIARRAHEETRRYCWTTVREQWLELYRFLGKPNYQTTGGLVGVA